MDTKGIGFLVIILIWGGLLYFLFNGSLLADLGGSRFFGSAALSSRGDAEEESQKEIIGILYEDEEKDFQKANVYFKKAVDIFDIAVFPDDSELLFAGSNRGLFVSRDGGMNWHNFSDLESKINPDTKVHKILFVPKTNFAYVSVFQNNKGTIYESRDKFFSLEKIYEVEDEAIYDFDVIGDGLYLGLSNGRLLFTSLSRKESRVLTTFKSAITGLKVSQNQKQVVYLTLKSGGFLKSKDGGRSFERMNLLNNYRRADKINDFELSVVNDDLIYAATNYGLIRSLNRGGSWRVFESLPSEEPAVSSLTFLDNPGEIFAASNGKIYESRDYGLNWKVIETGFEKREISVIRPNGDRIIIGTKR